MARINLLPWRAEQRERKNKEFITIVAVIALLVAALAFATWFFFNTEYKEQQQANANISSENAKLDIALKEIDDLENQKQQMIARMKVIQDLQGKRPLPVLVWDDLARSIPDTLYLTNIDKVDDTITIMGKADNPNVVSTFIASLDNSKWMGSSKVDNIREKSNKDNKEESIYPEDDYVYFKISTKIVSTATLEDINQSSNSITSTEDNENQTVDDKEETESPTDEVESKKEVTDSASSEEPEQVASEEKTAESKNESGEQ